MFFFYTVASFLLLHTFTFHFLFFFSLFFSNVFLLFLYPFWHFFPKRYRDISALRADIFPIIIPAVIMLGYGFPICTVNARCWEMDVLVRRSIYIAHILLNLHICHSWFVCTVFPLPVGPMASDSNVTSPLPVYAWIHAGQHSRGGIHERQKL